MKNLIVVLLGGGMMISMNSQWDNAGNEIKGHIYLINNTIADNYASSNSYDGEGGKYLSLCCVLRYG